MIQFSETHFVITREIEKQYNKRLLSPNIHLSTSFVRRVYMKMEKNMENKHGRAELEHEPTACVLPH